MKFEKSLESCKAPHGNVTNFVGFVQHEQNIFQYRLCQIMTNHLDAIEFKIESMELQKLIKIYFLLNEGRRFPLMAAAFYRHFAKLDLRTFDVNSHTMPDALQALLDEIADDLLRFISQYHGLDEIYKNQSGGSFFCPKQRCRFLALKRFAGLNALKVAWITVVFSKQVANQGSRMSDQFSNTRLLKPALSTSSK